jgi:leucyl aminopeptidase
MKLTTLSLLSLSAAAVSGRFIESHEQDQIVLQSSTDVDSYLIELSPGETRWVTEEEKWELRRVGCFFSIC